MSTITKEQAIEFLSNLDPMQLQVLRLEVERKLGLGLVNVDGHVMPSAPVPIYGASPVYTASAYGIAGTWVEEQYEFDVILETYGPNRIEAMKVVRTITGMGLSDSKALVDSLPKFVKRGVSKADAEDMKTAFAKIGAKASIK